MKTSNGEGAWRHGDTAPHDGTAVEIRFDNGMPGGRWFGFFRWKNGGWVDAKNPNNGGIVGDGGPYLSWRPAPDIEREFALVDLATLKVDGPAIVFLRPREKLTVAETERFVVFAHQSAMHLPGSQWVVVPHDVEIMALGDADLHRIGYTRVAISPAEQDVPRLD